jgi:hypothetical protein
VSSAAKQTASRALIAANSFKILRATQVGPGQLFVVSVHRGGGSTSDYYRLAENATTKVRLLCFLL